MRLLKLTIKNYKSLGDITFSPTPFSVLIGPNASGKSNFANAISFLSEVYNYDLETAIRRKGGFENIALRRSKRSRSAVEFSVLLEFTGKEGFNFTIGNIEIPPTEVEEEVLEKKYYAYHSFSFKSVSQVVKSDFEIVNEEVIIYSEYRSEEKNTKLFSFKRQGENIKSISYQKESEIFEKLSIIKGLFDNEYIKKIPLKPQQLWNDSGFFNFFNEIPKHARNWAVYQLSPKAARTSGVPTPNPYMNEFGENLPALVDWIINNQRERWQEIVSIMQTILPRLTNITTDFLHNKTLGLFFHEEGLGRPWNSEEVSDGTILTFSILCTLVDPRRTLILIEEPENSLHPWIIRTLIEKFKALSNDKNVIITTHSPILIDMVSPDEIWCISKVEFETSLNKLTDLSPELKKGWEEGKYKISDFLDSGLIPQLNPLA